MYRKHVMSGLAAVLLTALCIIGCDRDKGMQLHSGPPETPPAALLKSPFTDVVDPRLYELPSQALAEWRSYAKYKPALILYSNHPMLNPIPEERRKGVHQLLRSGTAEDIERRTVLLSANPLLIPTETVSAAIDNGIISELILVLPNRDPVEKISAAAFGKSAVDAGLISQPEADSLTLADGVIHGTVRGIPLSVFHPTLTMKISKPAILHVDLGYFNGMYVNEVKTPVYGLIFKLVDTIKKSGHQTLTTSLSFSNQEADYSLESRFVIRDLAELLRHPSYIGNKVPANWALRAEALYSTGMYAETRARELTLKSMQAAPDDAAAHYAVALDLFELGFNEEGFAEMDKAVQLDKGYALGYLSLAERGTTTGRQGKSIELLHKASEYLPNNPFIRIELASLLIEAGRSKEARPILAELLELDWSEVYHANIRETLREMSATAAIDPGLPASGPAPATGTREAEKPTEKTPKFDHSGMGLQRK